MRRSIIPFFLGIILTQFIPQLPSTYFLTILLLINVGLYIFFNNYNFIFWLIAGFCWTFLYIHLTNQFVLPKSWEAKPLIAHFTITSVPQVNNGLQRFTAKVDLLTNEQTTIKQKFLAQLFWYSKTHLLSGQQWSACVKLKRPHSYANPDGIDVEKIWFAEHIRARGSICSDVGNHLENFSWKNQPINYLRARLAEKIRLLAGNNPFTAIILAVTVGVQSDLSKQQWQILRNTGTNHLVAIAGLHIGIITGMVMCLINFIWRRFSYLCLLFPAQEAKLIAGLLSALGYGLLSGFALPAQRALIMLSVFCISRLWRIYLPLAQVLIIAVWIILMLEPLALLTTSFWLSFGCVALLIYFLNKNSATSPRWQQWGKMQLLLSLGLTPLLILFFNQFTLVAPVINVIAIIYVGFLVIPLSLLAVIFILLKLPGAIYLLHVAVYLLQLFWPLWQWFAHLPIAQISFYIPWYAVVCLSTAILLLLLPRGIPNKYLSIIIILPCFTVTIPRPKYGELWFTLLDVGQGLSVVLQTSQHQMIYDAGPRFGNSFDAGDSIVIPFLRAQHIRHIDLLMISHGDNDHIGGSYSILQQFPVTRISTSVPSRFKNYPAQLCLADQHWQWDGVDFSILAPNKNLLGLDNNSSCVLKVSTANNSLLLTGDIEKLAEHYLVTYQSANLPATIIVAPHHGSQTSSTSEFISAVHPQIVLFPVGYLNHYHFPHPITLANYQKQNVAMYRTDDCGAISVHFTDDAQYMLECYRQEKIYQ